MFMLCTLICTSLILWYCLLPPSPADLVLIVTRVEIITGFAVLPKLVSSLISDRTSSALKVLSTFCWASRNPKGGSFMGSKNYKLGLKIQPKVGLRPKNNAPRIPNNFEKVQETTFLTLWSKITLQNRQNEQIFDLKY